MPYTDMRNGIIPLFLLAMLLAGYLVAPVLDAASCDACPVAPSDGAGAPPDRDTADPCDGSSCPFCYSHASVPSFAAPVPPGSFQLTLVWPELRLPRGPAAPLFKPPQTSHA